MPVTTEPSPWARRGLLCPLSIALAFAVMTADARAEDGKAAVHIDNFAFVPAELKIRKGTEVTWTNNDDIPHTVVAIGSSIGSKPMDTDGTFSYKFEKSGTFAYICGLHPHMKAKVVVTD